MPEKSSKRHKSGLPLALYRLRDKNGVGIRDHAPSAVVKSAKDEKLQPAQNDNVPWLEDVKITAGRGK